MFYGHSSNCRPPCLWACLYMIEKGAFCTLWLSGCNGSPGAACVRFWGVFGRSVGILWAGYPRAAFPCGHYARAACVPGACLWYLWRELDTVPD